MNEYEKQAALEIAEGAKREGFRVFLAERGTYGFFTDDSGTRVVSFQIGLQGPSFIGNYKTSAPKQTGTGWQICTGTPRSYANLFSAAAPRWATGDVTWRYTTLAEHLKTYQPSSRYTEL